MSKDIQVNISIWRRAAVGLIAMLVVALSIAAGLAQNEKPGAGPIGGVRGGVPGGVSGGVVGGIPGGAPGGVVGFVAEGQERIIERLDQAPEIAIGFRNSDKTPVLITEARVRAVPKELGPGDDFAVLPVVSLANKSDRRIMGVTFELRNGAERRAYYEKASSPIEPHAMYISGGQKRFVILVGRPESWTLRVAGVVFEDGEVWGVVPPPPPPPPPPPEFKKLELAQETAIQSNTRGESPLSITSGTLKKVKLDPPNQEASATEERYLVRLSVTLINNTPRRITGVAIEYGDPNSEDGLRTYATVKIEPHGTYIFDCPPPEAPGFGAFFARGNQDFKRVSVIGVKFEDGEIWGSIPPPAPPPPPPPVLASGTDNPAKIIRKSGGVLAESATHRVAPESPSLARTARITGSVVVEVTVDEDGAVIAARAISGHPLLKDAAVAAARQWQFTPTMLSGAPVKVIGLLTFNFEP